MRGVMSLMCGPGDKTWIARTFPIFAYFKAKTNPDAETSVLGREKTETAAAFKIPQPTNTNNKQMNRYRHAKNSLEAESTWMKIVCTNPCEFLALCCSQQ